jgi:hypothetical protein
MPARPDRIRIGVDTLATRNVRRHFVAAHVRQVQIQQDDVVVVELAEIDAFLAEIGGVDIEPFGFAASARCFGAVALSSSISRTRIRSG